MKRLTTYLAAASILVAAGAFTAANAEFLRLAPPKAPQQENPSVKRSAEEPVTTNLFAVIPQWTQSAGARWASINPSTGNVTTVFTGDHYNIGTEYNYQSAALRDDILYIPYFYQDMIDSSIAVYWRKVDVSTGEFLGQLDFGQNLNGFCYGMTYDPYRDRIWGLSLNLGNFTYGNLIYVDSSQKERFWQPTFLGTNLGSAQADYAANIAYNPADHYLYYQTADGKLKYYDPDTDKSFTAATYDRAEAPFCFPEQGLAQAFTYSPRDRAFIGVWANTEKEQFVLFAIDADTFEAYEITDVKPISYVSSLHCTDGYADFDAPDQVSGLAVDVDGANTDLDFTFTAPSTTFDGTPLPAGSKVRVEGLLDGNKIFDKECTPGQRVDDNYDFGTGLHELSVTTYLGTKEGPSVRCRFYAGNDAPLQPRALSLNGYELSWIAPQGLGAHGGYLDPTAITYDIYLNGEKINAAPVAETHFTIPMPEKLARYEVKVAAVHGGISGEPTEAISRVLGPSLALPQTYAPTAADAALFDQINANNDDNYFRFDQSATYGATYAVGTAYPHQQPNDWFFLPPINFDSAEAQYSVTFDYQGYYANPLHLNSLDVVLTDMVGTSDDNIIYSHSETSYPEKQTITARFSVAQPGTYYIGFHEKGEIGTKYRGARFSNIRVSKLDDATAKAPGNITEATFAADPYGALKTTVTATAPSEDMRGQALDTSKPLTITASCGSHTASAQALPGQKAVMDLEVDANGFNQIALHAANEFGEGQAVSFRAYVGLDAPTLVRNIRATISDDNLGVHLTWEAPEAVGQNGGYVDPATVKYNINTHNGISNSRIASTEALEFDYRLPAGSAQGNYYIGVSAVNEAGESLGNQYLLLSLGTPYTLPMAEEFSTSGFSYSKWTYNPEEPFAASEWDNTSSMNGLGIGDPAFILGGMYSVNLGGPGQQAELRAPKFSMKDVENATLVIRYWDYPQAPDMAIWAQSSSDQTLKEIAKLTPERGTPAWKEWNIPMSSYSGQGWVQANLRTTMASAAQQCIIDSYSVVQEIESDFRLDEVSSPGHILVGETPRFLVTAVNAGRTAARPTLKVSLLGDGNVIESVTRTGGRIQPSGAYAQNIPFEMKVEYLEYASLQLRAEVEISGDLKPSNNVRTLDIDLRPHQMPVVTDLTAAWSDEAAHTGACASWSTPDAEIGGDDSFEGYEAFGNHDNIGPWRNVDIDKGQPFAIAAIDANTGSVSRLEWPGYDQPGAWQTIDAEALSLMEDASFKPRSGKSYLLARSLYFDEAAFADPIRSWDLLVSPEVVPGSDVTFYMNIANSQYAETITVFTSSTDDKVGETVEQDGKMDNGYTAYKTGSFRSIAHWTKNDATPWEEISFTLPADAKYFILAYSSYGQLGAMIDDITYEPAAPAYYEIDSYDVYRRDITGTTRECIARGVTDLSYVDVDNDDSHSYAYTVVTNVKAGEGTVSGPHSNEVILAATGISGTLGDGTFILSGRGYISFGGLEGQEASIFTADGKKVRASRLSSDNVTVAIEPGVYIVTVAGRSVKVLVR